MEFEPNDENRDLVTKIHNYNKRYSNNRSILSMITELPYLITRWIFSIDGLRTLIVNSKIIMCMLIAVVYVLSPFDLIPESVFGLIGMIDDFFIVITILVAVSQMFVNQYARNH